MGRLQEALRRLDDGDLHRAHRDGGWTVAQVISHMNVATLIWLGDLATAPPTIPTCGSSSARRSGTTHWLPAAHHRHRGRQIASTRAPSRPACPRWTRHYPTGTMEIPDLGTMTIAEWTPMITGHLASHVDQAFTIMTDREFAARGNLTGARCP